LSGVNLEFVKALLIASDLKINVRGREQTLGTKLHQATQAAIKKRTPALMAGLCKYNDLCATLAPMYNPVWVVPLPEALPTELKLLRESPSLMQDVWISRTMEEVPLWLQNSSVREGIRAMLKVDRCLEDRRRLEVKASNLSQWLARELAAVSV
ncbi:hypothetical protein DXG01_007799, partial [Tephrocybe rancida]